MRRDVTPSAKRITRLSPLIVHVWTERVYARILNRHRRRILSAYIGFPTARTTRSARCTRLRSDSRRTSKCIHHISVAKSSCSQWLSLQSSRLLTTCTRSRVVCFSKAQPRGNHVEISQAGSGRIRRHILRAWALSPSTRVRPRSCSTVFRSQSSTCNHVVKARCGVEISVFLALDARRRIRTAQRLRRFRTSRMGHGWT
jgi:hypothetical protein